MKYALLLMGHVNDPRCGESDGPSMEDFAAFDAEIEAAGVVVHSFALEDPEHGAIVATDDAGDRVVSSVPLAEVREFVGGTYIIDVPDLDAAISWAKRSPASGLGGHVEIRPVAPY